MTAAALLITALLTADPSDTKPDSQSVLTLEKIEDAQLEEAAENISDVLLKLLVKEAERRKVDPEVKEYLAASFAAWRRHVLESADLLKDFTQDDVYVKMQKRDPSLWNKLAKAQLESLQSLQKERYFARITDEEAKFGQYLATGRVIQVIDGTNLLADVEPFPDGEGQTIWLADVDTGGFVDDSKLDLTFFASRLWSIDKTSYESAAGAKRTVVRLTRHPYDLSKVTAHIELFKFGQHSITLSAHVKEYQDKQAKMAAATAKAEAEADPANRERRAAALVRLAKRGIDGDLRKYAKGKLLEVVEKYPETKAADEAKDLLKRIDP